ncbi:hypothetical protein GOV06_04030 [Candidatus Woesearchaeota archaeon]|nr:hypothetical protein [Candidatus Woesearchaeota archaeon]
MRRLVCFSSGCLYKFSKRDNYHEHLKVCQQLKNIDGVELQFVNVEKVMKFKFTKKELNFLRKLRFNTIHAPLHLKEGVHMKWYNNKKCKGILKKVHEMYDQIGACNIVFHPNQVKDFKLLKPNPGYQYSIETATPRHKLKIADYKKVFRGNPHLKLVLDTTHLVENSKRDIPAFVKEFEDKIIYTHLSAAGDGFYHTPLHMVEEKHLKFLESIKKLKSPVILESMGRLPVSQYNKEIRFVRKWLN